MALIVKVIICLRKIPAFPTDTVYNIAANTMNKMFTALK